MLKKYELFSSILIFNVGVVTLLWSVNSSPSKFRIFVRINRGVELSTSRECVSRETVQIKHSA